MEYCRCMTGALRLCRPCLSQRWLQKQAHDPFVTEARRRGYIARSAFKLLHLDDRFKLFSRHKTKTVVDLGCSPGGWCQVIRERAGDGCHIIGVDLLNVRASITNATFLCGDFTSLATQRDIISRLDARGVLGPSGNMGSASSLNEAAGVDVITSDMCPNRVGGAQDRQRICELNSKTLDFAVPLLMTGGHFVCKVLGSSHGSYQELYTAAHRYFLKVHVCKPPASRQHSDEAFLVGLSKLQQPRKSNTVRGDDSGGAYGLDDWPGFDRRCGGSSGGSRHGSNPKRRS